jgi:hypothetical protein
VPDDADDRAETGWLLEPPGPGEVQVNIEIGSNVELSPEARAALETLMHGLEEEEVAGFAFSLDAACGSYRICSPYKNCQPLTKSPTCFSFTHCRIAGIA